MKYDKPEFINEPISDTVILFHATTGVEDGTNVMYTTVKGIPPVFHVIDLDHHRLVRSIPLEAGDVWSHIVLPNGKVYIATNGQLWEYDGQTKKVEKVFTYDGETVFWELDFDENGQIYIGTYPGGKILRYDPMTRDVKDYGRLSDKAGASYIRSIAYSQGFIYGGTNHGEIFKVDISTGEKESLASALKETGFVYDLHIVDDQLLLARFDTPEKRYVYDLRKNEWSDVVFENSTKGLPIPTESHNGKVYLPVNGSIKTLDIETYQVEDTGMNYESFLRSANWIQSKDPELPGKSIVKINTDGDLYFFNPQTKSTKKVESLLPPSASVTHKFKKGENGKIYITAMQASHAAEFDMQTNQIQTFPMGQAGSIVPHEGKVYFGTYPGANVHVFDPKEAIGSTNPKFLFASGEKQDRLMYGIVGGDGKIYIPSIPDYGELGGAIVMFDPKDPIQSQQTFRHIVKNQSIISLTYFDRKIFGSTSIQGGLGAKPTEVEAKLFIWDVDEQRKMIEFSLDIPDLGQPQSIGGLSIGPDGLLWGGVKSTVFAMDPVSLKVVKYRNLFPEDTNWGEWGAYDIQWQNGLIYMCLGTRLVVIDPETLNFKHVANAEAFAVGDDGTIYFSPYPMKSLPGAHRIHLYRMRPRT